MPEVLSVSSIHTQTQQTLQTNDKRYVALDEIKGMKNDIPPICAWLRSDMIAKTACLHTCEVSKTLN